MFKIHTALSMFFAKVTKLKKKENILHSHLGLVPRELTLTCSQPAVSPKRRQCGAASWEILGSGASLRHRKSWEVSPQPMVLTF
jgi:hypothetical protein